MACRLLQRGNNQMRRWERLSKSASANWRVALCARVNVQKENPMNQRNLLSVSVVTVLAFALLPSSAVSQQKSLKDQLVGTWIIVSNTSVAPDGTKHQL